MPNKPGKKIKEKKVEVGPLHLIMDPQNSSMEPFLMHPRMGLDSNSNPISIGYRCGFGSNFCYWMGLR